ncbi:MAG: pantoate--beta-alanine ligase [Flavobacteriales bacterium]|nr:pantoate--beta-alanine ligase [Flavobacteriales bacterium]|tara:strand:+ start:851 stop:1684 length:834 start_codon:yes stop_codon:yes gene_type:complete
MQTFKHSKAIKAYLEGLKTWTSIGFVPTMGALHKGHTALIDRSVRENDLTICSIFVNPLQFNRIEDLDSYPDRMQADCEMLIEHHCDILFNPRKEDIYEDEARLDYDFGSIGVGMEAEYRPGHFQGVAEVIHRFFNILKPSRAYFGEKDYQQLAIIRWLVDKYGHDVEVVPCETIRDKSGLAMSSRNYNLSAEQYQQASEIYEVLQFCRNHDKNIPPIELAEQCFEKLKQNFKPEYFTIADQYTMKPLNSWDDSDMPRAFVAAYCGDVRLIDNIAIK